MLSKESCAKWCKDFAVNDGNDYTKKYKAEMDKRFEKMQSGIKIMTLDELEMNAEAKLALGLAVLNLSVLA